MSKSTRYFQLTPDILLEYNYTTNEVIYNAERNDIEGLYDIGGENNICVLDDSYDYNKYLFISKDVTDGTDKRGENVVSISKSNSKFQKYFNGRKDNVDSNLSFNYYGKSDDRLNVVFDNLRFHFTSRNFIGEYDALILQAYIYKSDKSRVYLMSFVLPRTLDLKLSGNPLLINQKLYTSYIDKKIISTDVLINFNDESTSILKNYLLGEGERFMINTPINIDVYGVKVSYDEYEYDIYKCEKINGVVVPCVDKYDNVHVKISEADDGDYYIIRPFTNNGDSFSSFISKMNEDVSDYVILHELSLREFYINGNNDLVSEITHKEHYVVNATIDYDGVDIINSDALDNDFLYRPICKYGSKCIRFVIEDIMRIVNTKDNTTIVKSAKIEETKPYKYGKHINKIYMGEIPVNINVFNKRRNIADDSNDDIIKFSTANRTFGVISGGSNDVDGAYSSGSVIQSRKVSINALCETTNIRISVKE